MKMYSSCINAKPTESRKMNETWFSQHFNIEGMRKINLITSPPTGGSLSVCRWSSHHINVSIQLRGDWEQEEPRGLAGPGGNNSKSTWTLLSWKVASWSQSHPVLREGEVTLGPPPHTGRDRAKEAICRRVRYNLEASGILWGSMQVQKDTDMPVSKRVLAD